MKSDMVGTPLRWLERLLKCAWEWGFLDTIEGAESRLSEDFRLDFWVVRAERRDQQWPLARLQTSPGPSTNPPLFHVFYSSVSPHLTPTCPDCGVALLIEGSAGDGARIHEAGDYTGPTICTGYFATEGPIPPSDPGYPGALPLPPISETELPRVGFDPEHPDWATQNRRINELLRGRDA